MRSSPSPEHIMNLGMAFWGSKTLLSAIELEVFTELAKQPLDTLTLQTRLGLHPRSARDFLMSSSRWACSPGKRVLCQYD